MRLVRLAVLLIVAMVGAVPAAELFDSRQFEQFLAEREKLFVSVWENEVRAGIDAVPDYAGSADDLPLKWLDCRTVPSLPKVGPTAIEMDRRLLALQFYLQQVVLYYLVGSEAVPSPAAVDSYAARLAAVRWQRAQDCVTDGPTPWPLEEIVKASYFHGAGDNYLDIVADAEGRPGAETIAHYVAAMPGFFVTIHEAGHHYAGGHEAENEFVREVDADMFAATVLAANQMPPVLGLPFLRLYGEGDRGEMVSCRLALVARRWPEPGFMTAYPAAYGQRLEALRTYYAEVAPEDCATRF